MTKSNKPTDEVQEREQRLRELTDQALQLLDQLAASRVETEEALGEREELRERVLEMEHKCDLLQRQLADTRRRVRAGRATGALGRLSDSKADVEIVLWLMDAATEVDDEWLRTTIEQLGVEPSESSPLTIVVSPSDPTGGESTPLEVPEHVAVIRVDSRSPGHQFNMGLASTEAPWVLFAVAGAKLDGWSPEALAGLDLDSVALGQPRIATSAGESIGLVEGAHGRMQRRDESSDERCDAVAPEAFFVSRAAYAVLDSFDEDLIGPWAAVEFSLRAVGASYRIADLRGCSVELPAGVDSLDSPELEDRDRLVVWARHRPGQLSAAFLAFDGFWDLPEAEVADLARAVYARLGDAERGPMTADLFAAEVTALRRVGEDPKVHAAQMAELQAELESVNADLGLSRGNFDAARASIEAIGESLRELHEIPCAPDSTRLAQLTDQLRELAAVPVRIENPGSIANALQELTKRVRLEIEAKTEFHAIASEVRTQLMDFAERKIDLASERQERVAAFESLVEGQRSTLHTVYEDLQGAFEELKTIGNVRDALRNQLEQTVRELEDLRGLLASRESWICGLLGELGQRRIKLRPRRLDPHEELFLRTHGPMANSGNSTGGS